MREHKSENKVQRIKDWLRRRVKEEDAVPKIQLQEVSPAVQCQLDHHLSHSSVKTLPTLRLPASRCLWSPWSSSTPPSLSAPSPPSPLDGDSFCFCSLFFVSSTCLFCRDCMDNVCQRLNLQQPDLFGLKYVSRFPTLSIKPFKNIFFPTNLS